MVKIVYGQIDVLAPFRERPNLIILCFELIVLIYESRFHLNELEVNFGLLYCFIYFPLGLDGVCMALVSLSMHLCHTTKHVILRNLSLIVSTKVFLEHLILRYFHSAGKTSTLSHAYFGVYVTNVLQKKNETTCLGCCDFLESN